MNPLFGKQTRFHRSISAKLNPEQEKYKFLKSTNESLEFHRQFNLRPKGMEVPSNQHLLNTKVQQNRQSFMKNITADTPPKQGNLSARQQLKSKLNPCNPFDSLTESSIKRNPQNQKAMELILAHKKIAQLQNRLHALTKELTLVKQQKYHLEKQDNSHLASMKSQINELIRQNLVFENKNDKLVQSLQKLKQSNESLKFQLQSHKMMKDHSPQNKHQTPTNNSQKEAQKFKELGQDFERKINDLYEQNYKLKNKVSWFEGKLEQSQTLVYSLKSLNEMLQKRFSQDEQEGSTLKEQLQKDNKQLREENLMLKQEKQTQKSQHEMEILKLQNELQELKAQIKAMTENEKKNSKEFSKYPERDNYGLSNCKSSYRKIMKLQDMIESLQYAGKDQIDQILRLKQKNKKLTKMFSLGNNS